MSENKITKCPTFIISPSTLTFSNYKHSVSYIKTIVITNNDVVVRQLSVKIHNKPEEISLQIYGNQKILPGLGIRINATFLPSLSFENQKFDRRFDISLTCKEINYYAIVPIILLSPSPNISFPKSLLMPDTTIYNPSHSVLHIINTGKLYQKFRIDHPAVLSLIPAKKAFILKPGAHESITIESVPKTKGSFTWELKICFDNNQTLVIPVYCNVCRTKISITKNRLQFPELYLGQSAILTTELCNDSNHRIKFNVTSFKNAKDTENFKHVVEDSYRGFLSFNYNRLPKNELIDLDTHHVVLDRELKYSENRLKRDEIHYVNNYFTIIPTQGHIAPQSKTLITVNFQAPEVIAEYNASGMMEFLSKAFIDVGSSEDRIEMELMGKVLGPDIRFETVEYFIGSIFCGQTITFSLNCRNFGPIGSTIAFFSTGDVENSRTNINVTPNEAYIDPLSGCTFKVSFSCTKIGKFLEFLKFKIENGALLKVFIKGEILPLNVIVSPSVINYNEVSICCRYYKYIKIKNPLPFKVCIKLSLSPLLDTISSCKFQEPLQFEEFHQLSKDNECIEHVNNSVSAVSLVSEIESCDDLISDLKTCVGSEMYKIVFDYEKILTQQSDHLITAVLSSSMLAETAIETVFSLFNNHIENEELKQIMKTEIFDIIERLIEKRKIADSIIDLTFEMISELIECFNPSTQSTSNIIPFTEKEWILNKGVHEYSVSPTFISLEPGETSHFCIDLIPNCPGTFRTNLAIQVLWGNADEIAKNCRAQCSNVVEIPVKHNCVIPKLIVTPDQIKFETVVGAEYVVVAYLENSDCIIDAFVRGIRCIDDCLKIECHPEKMMVPAQSRKKVDLIITPLTLGIHNSIFSFYTLGNNREVQLKLICNAIPAAVVMEPKLIEEHLLVNENHVSEFFVKNLSDVQLTYSMYLCSKNPHNYKVENCDGILIPNDIIQIIVWKIFKDPGSYEAKLVIEVEQGIKMTSRLISHVAGLPLLVTIPDQIDFGNILLDTEFPMYNFNIKNTGSVSCTVWLNHDNQNLHLSLSKFYLDKLECKTLTLKVSSSKPAKIKDELIIIGSQSGLVKDAVELKRVKITANIVKCVISWEKDNVIFDIKFGDKYEQNSFDTLKLRNCCPVNLNVSCECVGEYELINFEESSDVKVLNFDLPALSTKGIVVHFNTNLIKENNESCYFSGILKAKVMGKTIASVNLSTTLTYPSIEVEKNCFEIYQNCFSCVHEFSIYNSAITSEYRWEFLEESFIYKDLTPQGTDDSFSAKTVIDSIKDNEKINIVSNYLNQLTQFEDFNTDEDDEDKVNQIVDSAHDNREIKTESTVGKKKKKKHSFAVDETMTKISDKTTATSKRKSLKDKAPKPKKRKDGSEKTGIGSKVASERVLGDTFSVSVTGLTKNFKKGKKSRKSVVEDKPTIISEETELEAERLEDIDVTREEVTQKLNAMSSMFDKCGPKFDLKDEKCLFNSQIKMQDRLKMSHTQGVLQANESKVMSLMIEASESPYYMEGIFRLHVKGGKSRDILIKITNDEPKYKINQTTVQLGIHVSHSFYHGAYICIPWFAILEKSFTVTNLCWVPIFIKFNPLPVHNCFVDGHINITNRTIAVGQGQKQRIKLFCFMGLKKNFQQQILVSANEKAPTVVSIKGQAQVPLATTGNCFLSLDSSQADFTVDYESLQALYNEKTIEETKLLCKSDKSLAQTIDKITVLMTPKEQKPSEVSIISEPNSAFKMDSVLKIPTFKSHNVGMGLDGRDRLTKSSIDFPETFNISLLTNNFVEIELEKNADVSTTLNKSNNHELTTVDLTELDKLDFVYIPARDNVPSFIEIKNYLDHARFLNKVDTNSDSYFALEKFVQRHVYDNMTPTKLAKLNHYTYTARPSNFVIEPIPGYTAHSCDFDLGEIMLGDRISCTLPLLFHGPGRFSVLCRTESYIPGIRIWFDEPKFPHGDSTLLPPYKYTLRNYIPEAVGDGKYKNRKERIDEKFKSCDVMLEKPQHCHSHDFTKRLVHVRKHRTTDEKKEINKLYTGIRRKFRPIKRPFIYAEIFQETSRDSSNQIFKLNVEWTACSKHFSEGQELNEIFYVEIHLGATIPINLRGKIFKPYRCPCLPIQPQTTPCLSQPSTSSFSFE